ncbi:MAG: ROK family protein [Bauldia sp.]|nr:ROK family protein [Bauldia sp.]
MTNTPLPLPCLVGDIGGTNARFALVVAEGDAVSLGVVKTAAHPSAEAALSALLASAPARPRSAVLALAAPITGESVRLTNSPWIISARSLIETMGLEEVILLNDFEALSLSLPVLGPGDLLPIGEGTVADGRTKLVVGPGTGLGAAGLIHLGESWLPVPGEGGHLDIGPRSREDERVWRHLAPRGERIEGEAILSGPGLVRLYGAVARADGGEPRFASAPEITAAAIERSDAVAAQTLELFATYLGRYAGDLALVFLPRGGVYLAGGIARKLATYLAASGFRAAFVDKEPHRRLMEAMATVAVTHVNPALAGLAAFVRHPRRYRLDLEGRRWTP